MSSIGGAETKKVFWSVATDAIRACASGDRGEPDTAAERAAAAVLRMELAGASVIAATVAIGTAAVVQHHVGSGTMIALGVLSTVLAYVTYLLDSAHVVGELRAIVVFQSRHLRRLRLTQALAGVATTALPSAYALLVLIQLVRGQ